MRVGFKVGEEEEVGNTKSVREHGHGKRVIEMRWLNDGKAHAYVGRHGTAPDVCASPAVVDIVRGDRKAGLGLLHLLEHPGVRYGSSVRCAGPLSMKARAPTRPNFMASPASAPGLASHSALVLLSNINPWLVEEAEAGSGKMTGRVEVI